MHVLDHIQPVQIPLKSLRELHGLTLSEAARQVGIAPKTLKKYEHDPGKMPFSIILKITHFYGISVNCVFFGTNKECAASNQKRLDFKMNVGEQP